jgi:hypothetical protein
MKSKTKYKFQKGIQAITPDTPDYSKAYAFQSEQTAKNKGISQAAGMFSGAYAPIAQVGGMGADVIRNRAKNKKTGSTLGGAVEMGASGAALGAQLGPWGALAGGVIGAGYGAIKGAKDYEKMKGMAQEAEKTASFENANKYYHAGASTDAQAALAKKGKYKVKTKQPRLIETEGREPIFSPKKPDGTRDLLYYNPNDPTHEEGGVKAMVVPKAQEGKRKTKIAPQPKYLEDTDSWTENIGEIFDPTGISSWDDFYRSLVNVKNDPKNPGMYVAAGIEGLGVVPLIGKYKYLAKTAKALRNTQRAGKWASRGNLFNAAVNVSNAILGEPLKNEGYNPVEGAYKGRKIIPQYYNPETVGMGAPAFQVGVSKIMSGRKHSVNPEIEPPTPYELMPKPPKSRFNVKNNFKKGGNYIRTYQDGTESTATYKHTKTFKSKPAYQAALQAHDDSLNLYGQSRYFSDKVKESGLYNSTVENPEVRNITRTGTGKTHSPLKAYGAPNDSSEDVMTIAGMNPMRKDLYSRKENKYKSFKEYEEAKAAGNTERHEGYEINMYKHPEMALRYEPDTAQVLQPKKPKLNVTKDTVTVRKPNMVTNTTDTTSKQNKETVTLNKSRGKFVGREKTFFEKAGEFLNKVGPSNRMSNGKKVKVYK